MEINKYRRKLKEVIMEAIMNPPTFRKGMLYELYRQELSAWSEVTDINRNKQGIMVALSLPQTDEMPVREKYLLKTQQLIYKVMKDCLLF